MTIKETPGGYAARKRRERREQLERDRIARDRANRAQDDFRRRHPSVLKRLRSQAGLTQREVAEHLAVHPQVVSDWECGQYSPSAAHLEALAALYGCTFRPPEPARLE